ncbi:MAG: SOS response-associated peptidase, partial [Verrucomicrobiaceae bacterium]
MGFQEHDGSMCGRYVLKHSREELQNAFGFADSEATLVSRFNIAPTTQVPVVRQGEEGIRELAFVRWGLIPSWAKPEAKLPLMINARSETISEKPAFRSAYTHRRCLFPVSGYYEWQKIPGGKQPFYIQRKDTEPLSLAGIWESWKAPDGQTIFSAAIVTTAAATETAVIHDRMPVILPPAAWDLWMKPEPLSR